MGNANLAGKLRAIAAAVRARGGNEKSARAVRDFLLWRLARWEEAAARGDVDELAGILTIAKAAVRPSSFGWESIAYNDAAIALRRAIEEAAHAA